MEILKQIARDGCFGGREVAMRVHVALALCLLVFGCEPPPVWDRVPPRLLATTVSPDGRELALEFDEPVADATTTVDEVATAPVTLPPRPGVSIPLPPGLRPGKGHGWTAEVTDAERNVTSVAGTFYPANLHPAAVRLNEVRVAGSGGHTDFVELRIEASGSLGGWTLEVWSSTQGPQRTILPDVEVTAGDLVVVRYRPGVSDTVLGARDFNQADSKGLSATKGLLLLRPAPGAPSHDRLLYAKKPGEGAPLAEAAGEAPVEELDPTGCTATRTWCRTDGGEPRWIVVANGASTPGAPNRLTPWAGPTASRAPKSRPRSGTPRHRRFALSRARLSAPWSRPSPAPEARWVGRLRTRQA